MKELNRMRPSSNRPAARASQQSNVDAKSYVIISKLPADQYTKYVENKEASHLTGFAFVVIGIIHLAGGKLSEVLSVIKSVMSSRYLQKEKVTGPEGNIVMYELAERALDQSISAELKKYISQVVNKETTTQEDD
ncbi:Melanoma-associated antigen G1 [Rhynchospora pubera]|uniref:Melanoma-associated antigen G1 n=1 Tax=Rhynchospora pubera TaxID=906938 RepID=A0AAV8G996_9POAL|nr:Melanoma-associated antigen G1 [Rhynchospora pubera]